MKKYGTWSVQDEKLRIKHKDGEESVLFEDTSSISWIQINLFNPLYLVIGSALGIFLGIASISAGSVGWSMFLLFSPIIFGLILTFTNKIKHDNVNIETRGGKIIELKVPIGKGKGIMEQIEEEKRKWEISKK